MIVPVHLVPRDLVDPDHRPHGLPVVQPGPQPGLLAVNGQAGNLGPITREATENFPVFGWHGLGHGYQAGELEQTRDFIRWAGYYEAKLEREARYRQLVYEHLRELRRRSGLGALSLTPAGA